MATFPRVQFQMVISMEHNILSAKLSLTSKAMEPAGYKMDAPMGMSMIG